MRAQFYPDEGPFVYRGINLWRGVTRHKPYLTGRSIARIGARHSTLIVYPIRNNIDAAGNQLVNWVAEIEREVAVPVDWNKPARLEDFFPVYQDWHFDWLDVPAMIRNADAIFSYPMVDRDPLARWTFGRVTLLGDAAHPMYPQGGNGGAQAIIDAATLARLLASEPDPVAALRPMRRRGCRRPAASCCRTAPRRRTSSSTRWSSAPAASASTSSRTSSARTNCGRSSSAIRRSRAIMFNKSERGESMQDTVPSLKLTSDGAMKLLHAAMAKAREMGVPQCISIVDPGGHLLAFARMDGAFSQSIDTSLMKAMTAASYGIPTGRHRGGPRSQARHRDTGQARQPARRAPHHRRRSCHRRHRRGLRHRRAGPREVANARARRHWPVAKTGS